MPSVTDDKGNVIGFGYLRDLPDPRDLAARQTHLTDIEELPKKVDLRETGDLPPVRNQGSLGSCTGQALAYMRSYLEESQDGNVVDYSPLWIYYHERVRMGSVNYDSGAYIRDGMKVLSKLGTALEEDWPYVPSKFKEEPPEESNEVAKDHQILKYYRVSLSLMEIKQVLASGYPVVGGWSLFNSIQSAAVADTGVIEMPRANERMIGGHAMLLTGYDDTTGRFHLINSWGKSWGDEGYGQMDYTYCLSYGSDFWTCELVE